MSCCSAAYAQSCAIPAGKTSGILDTRPKVLISSEKWKMDHKCNETCRYGLNSAYKKKT